jgi:hypothetical protein
VDLVVTVVTNTQEADLDELLDASVVVAKYSFERKSSRASVGSMKPTVIRPMTTSPGSVSAGRATGWSE